MKSAQVLAALLIVAVVAVPGVIAFAAIGKLKNRALKPGDVVNVTYSFDPDLGQARATALLAFVTTWGLPLSLPSFQTPSGGRQLVSVQARANVALDAVPDIPSDIDGGLTVVRVSAVGSG